MSKKSAPATPAGSTPAIRLVKLSEQTPALKPLGGSNSDTWNNANFSMLMRTFGKTGAAEEDQANSEYAYAGLGGINPQDEIEGMMASQMVALHVACLDVAAKGMWRETAPAERRLYLAAAAKLSRATVGLVEALNRHRGKAAAQTVTVEHVHVHRHLHTHEDIGGDLKKLEEQAHAKVLTHAPITPVPSTHTRGTALPIAESERSVSVPDARRKPRKRGAKRQ